MTFLSPLFLLGVTAAAIPIVLHLLKREPEARVKFAPVRLLKQAPVEHTSRHRLRELLLLALRVASLVLLAVAFARPFFVRSGAATISGIRIIALDTSYSLSAPGRFARAQQLAREAVAQAATGELVGVVTFADAAAIAAAPSADHVLATATIDQAQVGFGGTRYRAAVSAAAQALAGRRGLIVVVTDLQENGWDPDDRLSIPDGTHVQVVDVGAMPANVAVTGVRASGDRIIARVYNGGSASRDVRAHLAIDGRPSGDAATTVAAAQTSEVVFPAAARGTLAAVSVEDPDGVQADNVRYLKLGAGSRPAVLVITGSGTLVREGFYLQHALEAGDVEGRVYRVSSISGAQLSTSDDQVLASYAAVVLASTRGLERHGREILAAYVRGGGGLLVTSGPDVDGDVAADVLGGAPALSINTTGMTPELRTLAPADVRHPVFRPFSGGSAPLALVRFQRAAHIDGDGCPTLARFTSGEKAMIECTLGDGRALVLASDLENRWNDFPLHASFVPFVHEAVRYLANPRSGTAEYLVGEAPPGAPKAPGPYDLPSDKPGVPPRSIVINVDPREADASRMTPAEFQSSIILVKAGADGAPRSVEARQQEDDQHLWQYALVLMVIALVAEGALAGRTA